MKLDFDLSREQVTVVVLAVGLALSAVVISPGMVFGPSDAPSDAKSGVTYTSEPVETSAPENGPPESPLGSVSMNTVPDGYTETSTEQAREPPDVQASAGAQTMQVRVVEDAGEIALQLEDDRIHDGRWVSVPESWFADELGEVPEVAYVAHESGDEYKTRLHTRGGDVAFYVEEFSTNTVTFSGEVSISGDFSDGGSAQYKLSNYDAASDPVLNLTGHLSTESEVVSASGISDGSVPLDIAGNRQPTDASVTFTGDTATTAQSRSGGPVSDSSSSTINIGGDDNPQSAEVTLTGRASSSSASSSGSGSGSISVGGNQPPTSASLTLHGATTTVDASISGLDASFGSAPDGELTEVTVTAGNNPDRDYPDTVEVYSDYGGKIGELSVPTSGETTKTFSTSLSTSGAGSSIRVESIYESDLLSVSGTVVADASGSVGGSSVDAGTLADGETATRSVSLSTGSNSVSLPSLVDWSVSWTEHTRTESPSVDVDGDGTAEASVSGELAAGETVTRSVSGLSTGSNVLEWSMAKGSLDWSLSFDRVEYSRSPSVDVDSDGTAEASVSGTLAAGETATRELPSLSLSDDTAAVSVDGNVDVEVAFTERTETVNPGFELNSESVSHTGTLADGETAQYNLSQTSLREGTNYVNVSVGDGTLSSDAPTPMVGVNLSHDAVDQQSVEYGGGQWAESYKVSETYASSRQNASLTVPFQSNVYAIQNVEAQTNASGWSRVEPANYDLVDTTLSIDLSSVYGGEIPEGTTVDVRTTGTTVDPIAGTIQVTDPSTPDGPLNSTVEIVDWGPDSALDISGTPLGDRVHYVENASYDSPDAHSDFEGDGTHVLELPNASADNSLTVRTLPLRIEPKQGDAHVSIPDGRVNETEPVYRVTPGDTVGDAYDVTFMNASDGEEYILWSETNEIVVDSGIASSPLTLTDGEDNVATMQFRLDDGTSGSSSDSGSDSGGGGVPAPMPTTGGDTNFVALIAIAIAGGLVIVASRNDGAVAETGANAANSIEGVLGRLPIAGPALGKGLGGLVESTAGLLEAVVGNQTVALGIVGAMLVGAVQGGIIEVPQSSLTLIVVAGIGIYSLIALREFGEFTTARWAAILAATTVVTLQTISEASLLTAIVESQVWPILALALVYLAWQGVQGLNTPDQVTNVQLDTEQSGGGDDG